MPGLAGIVSSTPRADISLELARMSSRLRHFPWYLETRQVNAARTFAIAHVRLDTQPDRDAPGCWLHGEPPTAFTRAEYVADRHELVVTNDRFGMMPLYYAVGEGWVIFATELKALLTHPALVPAADPAGWADVLRFGFAFGEKTVARGVRCLPGGVRWRVDGRTATVTTERLWNLAAQFDRPADRHPDLDALAGEFRLAVERCCAGDVSLGVSLSGGYDSRTIHAAIDHQRCRVQTLTLDVRGGADQIIAEQIARVTHGLERHRFIENSDAFFGRWPAYAHEMIWLTDGQFFDEACVMMSTLDAYRDAGIAIVLRGHGGEFTRMQWAYEFTCNRRVLACRNQSELGDQLESQLTCGLTPADFHELFRADWAQALTAATARTLPAALKTVPPHLHPLDQVSCLYGAEYLRRQSVPSLAELRSRVEVRLPFLDPAYLDLALRLPPSLRLGTTVHRHILARTRPALLRITNANTGAPAGAGDVRQRLARKWRALAKRHFGYDRFRHYVDVPAWLRGPLYQPIASVLLEPRTLDRGCFEPDAIRRLLTEHQTGVAQHAEKLLLLFYFELWHRLFLDGEPWGHDVTPAPPPGPAADFVVSQAGEVRRLPNKQIIGKTHLFSVDGNRGPEKGKQ